MFNSPKHQSEEATAVREAARLWKWPMSDAGSSGQESSFAFFGVFPPSPADVSELLAQSGIVTVKGLKALVEATKKSAGSVNEKTAAAAAASSPAP